MITSCVNYLRTRLTGEGFHRLPLSDDRVFSFLKQIGDHLYVVNLYDVNLYDEIKWVQSIKRFETDLYSYFSRYPIYRKFILNIFVGEDNLHNLYELLEEEPMNYDSDIMSLNWFADLRARRLLVPAQVPNKLLGIEKIIEDYLGGKEYNPHKNKSTYKVKKKTNVAKMTKVLIFSNILIWMILQIYFMGRQDEALTLFGLNSPLLFNDMEYWRLFTSMFTHLGISHLVFNMVSLYIYGDPFEKITGPGFFIELYLMSGLIAGISSALYAMFTYHPVMLEKTFAIGASGAIFGIAGGVTMLAVVSKEHIGRLTPMVIGVLVTTGLLYGFMDPTVDNVAHIAGFISGLLLTRFIFIRKNEQL